jgi:alginate O-acetyltransferase complex protein AlgI
MLFSSFVFIFGFLPVALAGYYASARIGHRAAAIWLVLASLGFYSYWKISFLPLLLISIAFNYSISRMITAAEKRPRIQSGLLIFGVAADLTALMYYKYLASLVGFMHAHGVVDFTIGDIILPLGISFFTFTQIGYLVDVKQGIAKTRDLLSYLLFVTFFPHLIAGPILHNREMMPQFADPATYRFSGRNLMVGLTIFAIGLAKKSFLADPMAADVAAGFAAHATAGMSDAWYAVVSYSLQLYFDFSGYSDMAIGLARMFNIRFPLNFNSPFKATTVIDYWQRWHMTLTRFITMYIYNPIALAMVRRRMARNPEGSRQPFHTVSGFASLVVAPTMITMGLAGVWHGAGLQYLVFGLLHGVYISVNHLTRVFFPAPKHPPRRPAVVRWGIHAAKVLAVYLAALVGFAFFRASSTGAALHMLGGMLLLHGPGSPLPFTSVARLVLLFAIVWAAPNTQQIMSRYEPALGKPPVNPYSWLSWQPNTRWAVFGGIAAAAGILAIGGTTEFLYFQF